MKILILTHRVPWPLQSGDRIRTFHFFNYLAERHEVALLSFSDLRSGLKEDITLLKLKCKKIEMVPLDYRYAKAKGGLALFKEGPISVKAFDSQKFWEAFRGLVETFKPDIVFTDSSALAQYPLKMRIPFVSDFMDIDSEKWRQFAHFSRWPLNFVYKVESRRLAQFEKLVADKAKAVFVVSDAEKTRLKGIAPNANICVIPHGIDKNFFRPSNKKPIPGRVVFVGVMNYFPNVDGVVWFCRKIWPKVLKQVPTASFYIVGANPTRRVRALKNIQGVEVTGSVPDTCSYVDQAEICVAPLRFSIGLPTKVLQALSMEKALVATSGAVQGLNHVDPGIVKIADNENDFADAVIHFLLNPAESKKYGEAGSRFVAKYHDVNRNLEKIKDYFAA